MATFTLTAEKDTFVGGPAGNTFYATAATLNAGDSLTGGSGTDVLALIGSGTFSVDQLATFTGFEKITVDNATNSVASLTLGNQPIEVDATGSFQINVNSPSNWNVSNRINGDPSGYSLLYFYNYGYPPAPLTYDLTSNAFSNIYDVQGNGNDLTLLINSSDTADIRTFSSGGTNDNLVTAAGTLDLSTTTVIGFRVSSTNRVGTTFTVGDLDTAFQIDGGPGHDTLIAHGFTLSSNQRAEIFVTSSIETIIDPSGTYNAPSLSPGIIGLTTGNDTFVAPTSGSTVYATAATLNAGDSLTGGSGTDVLALIGSGTFSVDQLATFTGFEKITVDNATNSVASLTLGNQPIEVDATGSFQINVNSPSNWNVSDRINGDPSGYSLLYFYNYGYPPAPLTYDLISNAFSNIYDVQGNGNDLTLLMNSSDTADIRTFSSGGTNDNLVTAAGTLDLSTTTVIGFRVSSTNRVGTTFTVGDLDTAFQIDGGPGHDTIETNAFIFTPDQRNAIFATASIEKIIDQTGTYTATGPTGTVIQTDTNSFGLTSLTAVANEYFLYNGSGSGPALKDAGANVTAGEFHAWVPIGAAQTASGYDVAWEIPGANEYTVWSTDSNGNYIANILGVVPGNDYALESVETTFNQDLNGDGTIGLTKTGIQTDTNSFGLTSLTAVANEYFLYNGSGSGPALKDAGANVTAGEFHAWAPIGAAQTASGYDVAWEIPSANEYTVWSTDSNGNYIANIIGVVPGNDYALESVETTFNQDLNGDGTIGLTKTGIQTDTNSFGLTSLTAVANEYFLYNGSGSGPALKDAGANVTAGEFHAWAPIGAAQTASGYDVAWEIPGANEYTVWSTDSNGNYIANIIGVVPGNDYALESVETTFNQDLNGDGTIGLTKTGIQTDTNSFGLTSLTAVANEYFLYNGGGSGPALKDAGANVTAGEFHAWVPIGAAQTASGYDMAWEIPGANEYTVWSTDSNGNYIANIIGVVPGNDYALESVETTFNQDLNGDSVIGLYATPGSALQISSPMTSAGSATIGAGATLEIAAADSGSVTFATSTGMLRLDAPSTFNGEIFNFTGNGSLSGSDQIDLNGINYGSVQDSFANGVLKVTDGVHSANLSMHGSYTLANFSFANDGSGGTIVYDPPSSTPTEQTPTSASQNSKTHVLTVTDNVSHVTDTIKFAGVVGSFSAQSDGNGGTFITDPPPPANMVAVSHDQFVFAPNLGENGGKATNANVQHNEPIDFLHQGGELADLAASMVQAHAEGAHLTAAPDAIDMHHAAALTAHHSLV